MQTHHATLMPDALNNLSPVKRYLPFMDLMPQLQDGKDPNESFALWIMQTFGMAVAHDPDQMDRITPDGDFQRAVVATETPSVEAGGTMILGAELVVGHWGKGFVTPIHQHNDGWMYGKLLTGYLLDQEFRRHAPDSDLIRQKKVHLYRGTTEMEHSYDTPEVPTIHKVTVLEPSKSIHFFPHQRTGTGFPDFVVEYFEEHSTIGWDDLFPITMERAQQLEPGRVVLVRSARVPELGDHWAVITGEAVKKPWGYFPQVAFFLAPTDRAKNLLNEYEDGANSTYGTSEFYGITFLQLTWEAERMFHAFHKTGF